ncbi:hypothetical protein [Bacillus paranthracis]
MDKKTKENALHVLTQEKKDIGRTVAEILKSDSDNDVHKLINHLQSTPPEEIGGRVALSGFYYQFLSSIQYFIELLDDKWDFVALELHEDIVVGKGNKVKFIQVKSSQERHQSITKVVYRDTKKINGKEEKVNNSWIDKLIFKTKYFKDQDDFETEFELLVNFALVETKTKNIIKHIETDSFPIDVDENDYLVKELKKDSFFKKDDKWETFDYQEECGETIEEALSRLSIKKGIDFHNLSKLEESLKQQLSQRMKRGIGIIEESFPMLIGSLMKKCVLVNEIPILFITKDEANEIFSMIYDSALDGATKTVYQESYEIMLTELLSLVENELKYCSFYSDLEMDVYQYKKYLFEWLEAGGSLKNIINKYVNGNIYSDCYNNIPPFQRQSKLKDIFTISLLLVFYHQEIIKFSERNSSLLTKELKGKYFSLLELALNEKLEDGLKKIGEILKKYETVEDIQINNQTIILQGNSNLFGREELLTFELDLDRYEIKEIPTDVSLDKVNTVVDIVSGAALKELYMKLFSMTDVTALRTTIAQVFK